MPVQRQGPNEQHIYVLPVHFISEDQYRGVRQEIRWSANQMRGGSILLLLAAMGCLFGGAVIAIVLHMVGL